MLSFSEEDIREILRENMDFSAVQDGDKLIEGDNYKQFLLNADVLDSFLLRSRDVLSDFDDWNVHVNSMPMVDRVQVLGLFCFSNDPNALTQKIDDGRYYFCINSGLMYFVEGVFEIFMGDLYLDSRSEVNEAIVHAGIFAKFYEHIETVLNAQRKRLLRIDNSMKSRSKLSAAKAIIYDFMICHELGHIALGHCENTLKISGVGASCSLIEQRVACEFDADIYAVLQIFKDVIASKRFELLFFMRAVLKIFFFSYERLYAASMSYSQTDIVAFHPECAERFAIVEKLLIGLYTLMFGEHEIDSDVGFWANEERLFKSVSKLCNV